MKVLITGANGLMGQEFYNVPHDGLQTFFAPKNELDITNIESIRKYVRDNKIGDGAVIVNCAANRDAEQMELTGADSVRAINIDGPHNLAIVANEVGATIIHFSSDYVFDGKQSIPYKENDKTNPLSVYGKLKVVSEQDLLNTADSVMIIRPAWIFSSYGKDFVKTIYNLSKKNKQLKVIFDQVGSPTYGADLARYVYQIIPQIKYGTKEIYHITNEGVCSWYDIACSIKRHLGLDCDIIPIHTNEFKQNAPRPAFSVLNKSKVKKDFDVKIRHYEDALAECCKKIQER